MSPCQKIPEKQSPSWLASDVESGLSLQSPLSLFSLDLMGWPKPSICLLWTSLVWDSELWGAFCIYSFYTVTPSLAPSSPFLPMVHWSSSRCQTRPKFAAHGGKTDPGVFSSQRDSWILPRARCWLEPGALCWGSLPSWWASPSILEAKEVRNFWKVVDIAFLLFHSPILPWWNWDRRAKWQSKWGHRNQILIR